MTREKKRARTRARNGLPSVVQRRDGRWAVTVELDPHPDGRRHRVQRTFTTEREATQFARSLDLQGLSRRPADARTVTVTDLMRRWLAQRPPGEDSTLVNRAWLSTLIELHLGTRRVQDVSSSTIRSLFTQLRGAGRAPSTLAKMHRVLRGAFDLAVRMGIRADNPVVDVPVPAVPSRVADEAWSAEDVQRIVVAARGSRLHAFVLVALATGARQGELRGARRTDYDPRTGTLTIAGTAKRGGGRGQGKTAAAHRTVMLPTSVQAVMAAHLQSVDQMRAAAGPHWGVRQVVTDATRERQREASRARAGGRLPRGWLPAPPPATPYEPLFPTSSGTPWLPSNLRVQWARILRAAGLPYRRLHSIRSAFITAALSSPDVTLPALQAAVGHTSPVMTLRYAQRVRGQQSVVAQAAAQMLGLEDR